MVCAAGHVSVGHSALSMFITYGKYIDNKLITDYCA